MATIQSNSKFLFSDAKLFLKSDKDGGFIGPLDVSDGFTIEPVTGDVPKWDFNKSDADMCFTAEFTMDKRTRRKLKKMMKVPPLKIQYRLLRPLQRVRLWGIVHWAKLFHKPFAISTDTGKMIVCKDINEML